MLEDDFNDCLAKAIRGLELDSSQLDAQFGIGPCDISSLLGGEMDEAHVRSIAPQLGLNADKLIQLKDYSPTANPPAELHTFTTPFGHLGVNAYVVATAKHFLIFDTGTDPSPILQLLAQESLKEPLIFITHHHPDHVAGLGEFPYITMNPAGEFHGATLSYDEVRMSFLDVSGHASPASAYLLESDFFDSPICIVGDAIFAGSIGGCQNADAYQTALKNIKQNILCLPDNTILCPGHGPLTTVAQEMQHNPFF